MPAAITPTIDPSEIDESELDAATARYYIALLLDEARTQYAEIERCNARQEYVKALQHAHAWRTLRDVARAWADGLRQP